MENTVVSYLFESDIRFLEYRLDVIGRWPESPRKRAIAEAISWRLAAIGRATLGRPEVDSLLAASCRLLDHLFSANTEEVVYSRRAA